VTTITRRPRRRGAWERGADPFSSATARSLGLCSGVDAAIGLYGLNIAQHLDEAAAIKVAVARCAS